MIGMVNYYMRLSIWWKLHEFGMIGGLGFMLGLGMNKPDLYLWLTRCFHENVVKQNENETYYLYGTL